ncbi:alpha/beta hydrolase [Mycolicibacterium moriokaense]|nr:alpha/beta hydrolase [Mycolicibacterium moriokaense]
MTSQGEKPSPNLCSAARLLARGKTTKAAIAAAESLTALPVIGPRLDPLVTMTAIGAWGSRQVPRAVRELRKPKPDRPSSPRETPEPVPVLAEVCSAALQGILGELDGLTWPLPQRAAPMLRLLEQRRRHLYKGAVQYGPDPTQLLDVWRRPDLRGPAPVLIFVPGGAWVHGSRTFQGSALMSHLVEAGWVCLAIDYRVSPRDRWPRHVMDVKAAIAWARANVDEFGGDRDFVAVAGCSAGGHLASLAALTPGDEQFDAGLPAGADTTVDAVVSLYGRYDWHDRSTPERDGFVDFLENIVVQRSFARHEEMFRNASPIARLTENAPPFFVIHGDADFVIPVAQARHFVRELQSVSRGLVGYLELPGAQHGFDLIDGGRTGAACTAISLFLNEVHRRHTLAASA